ARPSTAAMATRATAVTAMAATVATGAKAAPALAAAAMAAPATAGKATAKGGPGKGGGAAPKGPRGKAPARPRARGTPAPDPAPDNGVLPPGVWPIIGPEIATYGVVQPIARQMGLTTLGTFHERVGDAAADAACVVAPTPNAVGIVTKAPPLVQNICRPAVW